MPPSKQPPKRRSTCVKPPASSKNKVPVTAPQHSIAAPIFYEVTQNKLKNGTLICETNPSNEYHIYTIPNHL